MKCLDMLHVVKDQLDPLMEYLKDDPVRPEIPADFRISKFAEILALVNDNKPEAIVCVAYRDFVPKDCEELFQEPKNPTVAVFYTIWSYRPGAGRDLIQTVRQELPKLYPNLEKFVTLSPQTEMAKNFHLKNGANIFRENTITVNYEYA